MAKLKMKEIIINQEWCKGCGICIELCPVNVLEFNEADKSSVARPEDCIGCQLCELRCPDLAIEVIVEREDADKDG